MKRIVQLTVGAVLFSVLAVMVASLSVAGTPGVPNAKCPALRTDALGAPLNPPYSNYVNPGPGSEQVIFGLTVYVEKLPCCATITYKAVQVGTNPITGAAEFAIQQTVTPVAADANIGSPPDFDGTCDPPAFNVSDQTITDPITGLPSYPTFPHFCPAQAKKNVTMETVDGAVRNCIPPSATLPDIGGGSNFTGGNAG